jgi:hypothetical protein
MENTLALDEKSCLFQNKAKPHNIRSRAQIPPLAAHKTINFEVELQQKELR